MASVHHRPRSPFFFAAFRGADGRLVLRSTKQTDRAKALALALEFERAAKLAKRGELVEAQARDILADIMKRADTGETLRSVSIADHFRSWLATREARKSSGKQARKSSGTAVRYGGVVEGFLANLGNRAAKPLTALVAKDVDAFLGARLKQGVSPTTACVDMKVLRTALSVARRKGLITTNPAEAVELPDAVGMKRSRFTPTEVRMLVDAAEGEWKTLILLAYFTGARLGDCCRMAWEGVNLVGGTLSFTQDKTRLKLTVPLHPDLLAHLEARAGTDQPSPFVMPGMADKESGGRNGLSESFKAIVRRAGLDLQTVQGHGKRKFSGRTFHALRHSFTSALANAGVAPELRMKLTGHKSEAIHAGYTHHELETLRAALWQMPGLTAVDTGKRG